MYLRFVLDGTPKIMDDKFVVEWSALDGSKLEATADSCKTVTADMLAVTVSVMNQLSESETWTKEAILKMSLSTMFSVKAINCYAVP